MSVKYLYLFMASISVLAMFAVVPMALLLVFIKGEGMPIQSSVGTILISMVMVRIFKDNASFFYSRI